MEYFTVKNKRLKMSPGGLISLPVSARKALGMRKGEGTEVAVDVDGKSVILSGKPAEGVRTWPVSKKGQMELGGEAKELLINSPNRHYWLQLDDENRVARLLPF